MPGHRESQASTADLPQALQQGKENDRDRQRAREHPDEDPVEIEPALLGALAQPLHPAVHRAGRHEPGRHDHQCVGDLDDAVRVLEGFETLQREKTGPTRTRHHRAGDPARGTSTNRDAPTRGSGPKLEMHA
jgi:hypothetical protein